MPGRGLLNLIKRLKEEMSDERFIMHRYKSTRIAVLVGSIMILVLFTYGAVVHETIRWDLFSVSAAMALVKVCAMAYYRRTN
jgi:bacteriorhodopsin